MSPSANPQSAPPKANRIPHSICPECGASVKPQDATCWLCRRSLVVVAEVVEPAAAHRPGQAARPRANPAQFSLETLMLIITLIAVCLGMIMALPGVGILVSIVAAPALVRTLVAGYQDRVAGTPMTLSEKLMTFAASTGVALAVLAAGGTAFAAACFGSCMVAMGLLEGPGKLAGGSEEAVIYSLIGFSALVGLGTAGWVFWLLRPQRAK
jgi:hypothetical protein